MPVAEDSEIVAFIRKLRRDPSAVPLDDRLELGRLLEETLTGGKDRLPRRMVRPLAKLLAVDPWYEVRQRVANILDLLDDEVYDALWPVLSQDNTSHVRVGAERADIRRRKARRHDGHIRMVMAEMAKLAPQLAAEEPQAKQVRRPMVRTAAPDPTLDIVTLVEFMDRWCEPVSDARVKRAMIIKAVSHGTIKFPPEATKRHRGQALRFVAADLIHAWTQWIEAGLPLPKLRPVAD